MKHLPVDAEIALGFIGEFEEFSFDEDLLTGQVDLLHNGVNRLKDFGGGLRHHHVALWENRKGTGCPDQPGDNAGNAIDGCVIEFKNLHIERFGRARQFFTDRIDLRGWNFFI